LLIETRSMADELERAARINAIFESYVDAMEQAGGNTRPGELKTRLLALEAFVETALLVLARDLVDVDAFLKELGQRVASARDSFDLGADES
jgi:hypothetical protein